MSAVLADLGIPTRVATDAEFDAMRRVYTCLAVVTQRLGELDKFIHQYQLPLEHVDSLVTARASLVCLSIELDALQDSCLAQMLRKRPTALTPGVVDAIS